VKHLTDLLDTPEWAELEACEMCRALEVVTGNIEAEFPDDQIEEWSKVNENVSRVRRWHMQLKHPVVHAELMKPTVTD
jgi:hypothetical protein